MSKREAIIGAYLELLDEKNDGRITVNEIVSRCGIGRNTFYYYFSGIPALVDALESDWVERLCLGGTPESVADCVAPLVDFAADHRKALLQIYRSGRCERLLKCMNRIWSAVALRCAEYASVCCGLLPEEAAFLARCLKCAFVGVSVDWLESDMEYDLAAGVERAEHLLLGPARRKDSARP